MASPNLVKRFAEEVLDDDGMTIAAEILNAKIDAALAKKDKARLSRLFILQEALQKAQGEPVADDAAGGGK